MTSSEQKSPQLNKSKLKIVQNSATASDSDASVDTNSLSDSTAEQVQNNDTRKTKNRKGSEWEIVEGLKDGQRFENIPNPFNGYLHKKRKWPMKGWHKRYFILDKGILVYGKSLPEINKGKIHGSLDLGLSVITTKITRRRIDIDAEEFIYHLKVKAGEVFDIWIKQLTAHRLYRQHILIYGTNIGSLLNPSDVLHGLSRTPEIVNHSRSLTRGVTTPASAGFLNLWLQETITSIEQFQKDASLIDKNLINLSEILQHIESKTSANSEGSSEILSTITKKDRKKFGLKKKKSSKGSSVDLNIQFSTSPTDVNEIHNMSPLSVNSFMAFSTSPQDSMQSTLPVPGNSSINMSSANSVSNIDSISSVESQRREFVNLARTVLDSLKTLCYGLDTERDKLKVVIESELQSSSNISSQNIINLTTNLNKTIQQNSDLRNRLIKIHEASDLSDLSSLDHLTGNNRPYNASLSYSSSCVSTTEFFDAEDFLSEKKSTVYEGGGHRRDEESEVRTHSESSSEAGSLSSGEGSITSESEVGTELINPINTLEQSLQGFTGRRNVLPAPRPHREGVSLWNLLSRNIGKDLSQISMPVALNEPLNVLQRMCEELEYSELLDKAANIDDPYERMVQVAAFAVSSYASTLSRAGNKPFNPLLGETYECIREDKGFRFLAEQVSHHPPISTCYAESSNFTFWQDARVKTKFWGKSMEFQPLGHVHVLLPRAGELYSWNKVTTCVHNLFSNQRWVDQYGELKITSGKIVCKLTFSKASYWSAKRHEVVGAILDESGKVVKRLFGRWSESLYCGVPPSARCVWRAGTLPPNHEMYYGFTQFAIELNEIGSDAHMLPPTDTRFRPDQRALEEGDLNTAEALKLQLECAQRERRKRREELSMQYEAKWFSNSKDDKWEFNDKYWDLRKSQGFSNVEFEPLW